MQNEIKARPPGKKPMSKNKDPGLFQAELAQYNSSKSNFVSACDLFVRHGDALADPSVAGFLSYRRSPETKSFLGTPGSVLAMKAFLGIKALHPIDRITLMQLALMDCKVCIHNFFFISRSRVLG